LVRENHVELRTGRRAAHLDVARATVTLDQGETNCVMTGSDCN